MGLLLGLHIIKRRKNLAFYCCSFLSRSTLNLDEIISWGSMRLGVVEIDGFSNLSHLRIGHLIAVVVAYGFFNFAARRESRP